MIEIRLPRLYAKQRAAFFGPERVAVTEGSTKSGKSVGILAWLLYQAVNVNPGASRLYVAPVYDLSLKMWSRMCRQLVRAKLPDDSWSSNKSELTITVPGGSKIFFRSGDDPNRIYGADYEDAAIDEGSRCKDEVWDAVVSTTTATRGRIRVIGNVKGKGNWFYRLCRAAQKGDMKGATYHRLIAQDAVDGGVLDASVIVEQRELLPEHVFNELYLCVPADDGANPFGDSHISACIKPLSERPPVVFGVDLAKTTDWTVLIALDANEDVCGFHRWQMLDWETTGQRVIDIIGKVPTLLDATGVGSPVMDRVHLAGANCTPFIFTSSEKLRIMSNLIVGVQRHQLGFPSGPIQDELQTIEYKVSPSTKMVQYGAPDGLHDDCVMALALAYSHLPAVAPIGVPKFGVGVPKLGDRDLWQPAGGRRYRALIS